jgi:hypothetical protein
MLDGETNRAKLAKIAAVAACFYTVGSGKAASHPKKEYGRIDENALAAFIAGTVDGVADLLGEA